MGVANKKASKPPPGMEPLPGAVAPPNVWAEPRSLFFFRTGRLFVDESDSICEILALAETGAVLRSEATVAEGDSCMLELNSAHCMQAKVAWADNGVIGLRFTDRKQVLDILSRRQTSFPYRPPRLRLAATLEVRLGAQKLKLRCQDISESGIKVELPDDCAGADAEIMLSGVGNVEGRVRWWREGKAGISFVRPIPSEAFTRWVNERLEPRAG